MVKASSINPGFMITVGLCVANSLTGLSGALLAQYQKSCDINLGTGMVTIALASLIIGESIIGKGSILKTRLRSGTRKLSVPLFGCGSASLKCSGGMLKAGFRDHRCGSDRAPVFKKARGVFQTEIDRDPKEKGGFVCCS